MYLGSLLRFTQFQHPFKLFSKVLHATFPRIFRMCSCNKQAEQIIYTIFASGKNQIEHGVLFVGGRGGVLGGRPLEF